MSRWLQRISLVFVGFGALVALWPDGAVFAIWRAQLAHAFFEASTVPQSARPMLWFILGITGASILGKWLATWWVLRLGAGARWSLDAALAGLVAWWLVDSAVSIATGALFNVLLINVVPLLLFGAPAWIARRRAARAPSRAVTWSLERGVLALTLAAYAAIGFVVAAWPSPIFELWLEGAREHFYGGVEAEGHARMLRFGCGLIGGAIAGQFVVLGVALWRGGAVRALAWASLGSTAAWFALDTSLSVAREAWFNVWLINAPCMASLTGVVIWIVRRGEPASSERAPRTERRG